METKGKKHILKIFSGPHVGAEIPIGDGPYVIGGDENCDIILTDQTIASRHIKVTVSDGDLSVLPMEADVYIDGEKVEAGETALSPYQIVTIGTTHLGIGPTEGSWPQVDLPDIILEKKAEKGQQEESDENQEVENPIEVVTKAGRKRKVLPVIGLSLFLIIPLVFFLTRANHTKKPDTVPYPALEVRALSDTLQSLGQPDLKVHQSENGRITVQGYVASSKRKWELARALREFNPPVQLRVHVVPQLVESSREILNSMGVKLDVQSAGGGKILLQGYVRERADLEKALKTIQQDIPGIQQVENQVITQDDLISTLSEMLDRAGCNGKLRLQKNPGYILASGSLSEQELEIWKRVKKAFLSRYERYNHIMERVSERKILKPEPADNKESPSETKVPKTAVAKNADTEACGLLWYYDRRALYVYGPDSYIPEKIDLPIKAISMGNPKYITMADGTRYIEGEQLQNGYILNSIDYYKIVLIKGACKMTFSVGGK